MAGWLVWSGPVFGKAPLSSKYAVSKRHSLKGLEQGKIHLITGYKANVLPF